MGDTRDAHRAKAEATLDEWSARLKQLEAKARGASADARIGLDDAAEDLRTRIDGLRGKVDSDKDGLEGEIESFSKSAEGMWEALKDKLRD